MLTYRLLGALEVARAGRPVGPVDLALSRLYLLLGDLGSADRDQAAAQTLGERAKGPGSELAAAVLKQQIGVARDQPPDVTAMKAVAEHARRLGFHGIERDARLTLTPPQ